MQVFRIDTRSYSYPMHFTRLVCSCYIALEKLFLISFTIGKSCLIQPKPNSFSLPWTRHVSKVIIQTLDLEEATLGSTRSHALGVSIVCDVIVLLRIVVSRGRHV